MAPILLVFFILLSNGFVGLAMANGFNPMLQSDPPVPSPRKLGKHQMVQSLVAPSHSPTPSPSTEPQGKGKVHYYNSTKESNSLDPKAASEPQNEENVIDLKGQEIHVVKKRHHAVDKSVAGGGLILGGLATSFLVAVFCYIRATGRHKQEITTV
ncbi:hypothetical protein JCGZ_25100 [Jatropha curcas]|uniref:Transmembrane protein n=1 Tax=Jatropha curcas TaxID=180498 RepID=A0A067JKM7_JATCU|nr:hypothetical protein JCGZ_25100 [Jatropha curcas]